MVHIFDGEPVNLHRPSVDVLFNSAAQIVSADAMGVILTGMGSDGARGLLAMKRARAHTIAQDEKSCVVFGMPDQAIRMGGVNSVVALDNIAEYIVKWTRSGSKKGKSYG